MRRREFITLVGGAAAWPLVTHAQQSKLPVVGYLHTAASEPYAFMMSAFRNGLKEAGFVEGQNVVIKSRWAEGQIERLPALAADLVRDEVTVLATGGGESSALAAKRATSTIPIVFVTGSDPVQSHLVDSLNRPGGNLTGITFFTIELGPKRLGLLRELVPSANAVALLVDAKNAGGGDGQQEVENAARLGGPKLQVLKASNAQEIDQAFNAMVQMRPDALLIVSSPLFTNSRHQIVTLANHHRIPAIYPLREYVLAGGLLSYGASIADAYRQSGVYAGRILQGAKANDLPIQQPTKFELAINLKAAKSSGIEIPAALLARADEVIE